MIIEPLTPDSAFSRAIYTEIRPAIPRQHWPVDALKATFTTAANGLALSAEFEGLPVNVAAVANHVILKAGVSLVLASPVAPVAARVVASQRWRDMFLYAFLPLLFAIPLMGALAPGAMKGAIGLFGIEVLGLIATHARLMRWRGELARSRFVAQIPTPGLRIKVPVGTPVHHQ
jgi:uncharacterized membrane protein YhaH (DUF805 family)